MNLMGLTSSERRELADKAGTDAVYLWQCGTGRRRPSPALSKKLVAIDNRLTLAELRPDIWGTGTSLPTTNDDVCMKRAS